jgi:mono/diheme cytochrome c family protein
VRSIRSDLNLDRAVFPAGPPQRRLNQSSSVNTLTSGCNAMPYRDTVFGALGERALFTCEPANNLVHVSHLHYDGPTLTTQRPEPVKQREFLASRDPWFRPVMARTGPDGALYVVDMYRLVLEHPEWIPAEMAKRMVLRGGETMGRIWRIAPSGHDLPRATFPIGATASAMASSNGWVRDTAQRLIVESADASAVPALKELLQNDSPIAREHALWTLDGLAAVTPDLVKTALTDSSEHVRAAAARVAPRDYVFDLAAEKHPLVLANLAIKTINDTALAPLLATHGKNALIREAALTGLRGKEAAFAKTLAQTPSDGSMAVIGALAELIALAGKAGPIADMLDLASNSPENRDTILKGLAKTDSKSKSVKLVWLEKSPPKLKLPADLEKRLVWPGKPGAPAPPVIKPLTETQTALFEKGKTIYATLCAACHQPHGFGLDGLAPPLVDSEWVLGKTDVLARIVMHGLAGPVKVSGRTYNLAMPPLPQLTDEDIAGVLTYIRREWEHSGSAIETKAVAAIRDQNKGRMMMWTEEELKNLGKKK